MQVEEKEYIIRKRKDTIGQESGIAEDLEEIDEVLDESEEIIHKIEAEIEGRHLVDKMRGYSLSIIRILISLVLGIIFGIAIEKSRVYEPRVVRQQMIFENFKMIKLALSSLAVSIFSVFLVDILFNHSYKKVLQNTKNTLKGKSILTQVLGGLLIGFGIQISGSMPDQVLIQLAAGVPNAYLTLYGCLLGSLAHGLLHWYIKRNTRPDPIVFRTMFESLQMDKNLARLLFVITIGFCVSLIRYFYPSEDDIIQMHVVDSNNVLINYKLWSPYLCGILIGALQFVSLVALEKSLDASSAFMTLVGYPFTFDSLKDRHTHLALFGSSFEHWLTVVYCLGACVGAFISSKSSGTYSHASGVHPYNALIGGFLISYGAAMASGCTSKHLLSGNSFQFIGSFITSVAIMIGAVCLAFYAKTNSFLL